MAGHSFAEIALCPPLKMPSVNIVKRSAPIPLNPGITNRVGEQSSKGLKGIGLEIDIAATYSHRIGPEQMIELCQSDIQAVAQDKAATTQHVIVVEPLCRIAPVLNRFISK